MIGLESEVEVSLMVWQKELHFFVGSQIGVSCKMNLLRIQNSSLFLFFSSGITIIILFWVNFHPPSLPHLRQADNEPKELFRTSLQRHISVGSISETCYTHYQFFFFNCCISYYIMSLNLQVSVFLFPLKMIFGPMSVHHHSSLGYFGFPSSIVLKNKTTPSR